VKFTDFELITRSKSVAAINTWNDLAGLALELLRQLMPPKKSIRLFGISVSGFDQPGEQRPDQLSSSQGSHICLRLRLSRRALAF
jgi:DNA polymerase IV